MSLLRPSVLAKRRLADLGLLALRLFLGLTMMISHGIPKIERFSGDPIQFADPLGVGVFMSLLLAVFAEVVCSAALALGLLTRLVCIPLLVTMLVAVFVIHADDPWNKKEFALLYAVPYLTLMLTGPGQFSVDRLLFGKSKLA